MRARAAQAARAIERDAAGGTDVSVLEILHVFGMLPGRISMWRNLFFEPMRLIPGSTRLADPRCGQRPTGGIRGGWGAQRGRHGTHYPLSDVQWTWAELFGLVRETMGRG